ncbi:MAG: homoserine kinase [Anaerolineales bacterium]|jgi:homoserine kinase
MTVPTHPAQGRPMTSVTVRVPATTANLGPGFDCLGLALTLENQVSFAIEGRQLHIEVIGEGAGVLPEDATNLVYRAMQCAYTAAGRDIPAGLHIRCKNRIPTGSGLGSSAAAVLAGLLGANALMGSTLSVLELLRLGTDMEGHPDNIAAALFGGLVLVATPPSDSDEPILVRRVKIPPPDIAVVVPAVSLSTQAARQALPAQVPLRDAVYNLGRAIMVVEALRSGDLDLLGRVMQDRLHQPYRLKLVPGAEAALQAARETGASAAALSGAGPGVIAFCRGGAEPVGQAMAAAFQAAGISARSWVLRAADRGYQLRGIHV